MITVKLLEIDTPTRRGTIYPKAIVEAAIADYFKQTHMEKMFIFSKPSIQHSMTDVVGMAEKFRIEDGYLVADVGFLKEKLGEVGNETICIRPNGLGSVNPDTNIVNEDYTINGLTIVHKKRYDKK